MATPCLTKNCSVFRFGYFFNTLSGWISFKYYMGGMGEKQDADTSEHVRQRNTGDRCVLQLASHKHPTCDHCTPCLFRQSVSDFEEIF